MQALAAVSRYARITELIATDRCVMLDGATGTELVEVSGARPEVDEHLWGLSAVVEGPARVHPVHRRYVDAGCDVICTKTWGLATSAYGSPWVQFHSRHPTA